MDNLNNIPFVVGVGMDIVDLARIQKVLLNQEESFLERTFT